MENIFNQTTLKITAAALVVVLAGWLLVTFVTGLFNSAASSTSMYDRADAAFPTAGKIR